MTVGSLTEEPLCLHTKLPSINIHMHIQFIVKLRGERHTNRGNNLPIATNVPYFYRQVYTSLSKNPWESIMTRLIGEAGPGGYKLDSPLIWKTAQHALSIKQVSDFF